ncbi:5626_t:CDS:2, partial [Funneliformis geosporum]
EQLALVYRKGVHSYDYIDSQYRFQETELPLIHEFYNTLKGEYHDLYLKTDVLSLADIWTEFQKMSIEYYELDPNHYVSAPSLFWDGMLKISG